MRQRAEARKLDPLLSATFDTVALLGEARTVIRTRLNLEVLRAPLERVMLRLAKGQTIRALSGKKIRTWRVTRGAAADATDQLEIRFVEPIQGTHQLNLEAELPRDGATVEIPIVGVANAVRFRGLVGLMRQPEVRLTEIVAEGARRLDTPARGIVSSYDVYTPQPKITVTTEAIAAKTRAFTRAMLVFAEGGKR